MGIEMSVTEFKAKCLELFTKMQRRELDSVSITKRGEVVAELTPPKAKAKLTFDEAMARYHKALENKPVSMDLLDPDLDLTKPVFDDYDDFNAFHGKLLSQDE